MLNYWEKFDGTPTVPPNRRVRVTLNWKGVIYLNSNAYSMLNRPEAIALYFNRAEHMIGVTYASVKDPNAFPVRQNNNAWLINAMPFCKRYGIRIDQKGTVVFPHPTLDQDAFLRLDLKTIIDAPRRPQGPRKGKSRKTT